MINTLIGPVVVVIVVICALLYYAHKNKLKKELIESLAKAGKTGDEISEILFDSWDT